MTPTNGVHHFPCRRLDWWTLGPAAFGSTLRLPSNLPAPTADGGPRTAVPRGAEKQS